MAKEKAERIEQVHQHREERVIPCRGCSVTIWFKEVWSHKKQKNVYLPITLSTGIVHYATCPAGDQFRKKKE